MEQRTCRSCGEEKPLTLEYFQQGKNKRNGVEILYWYKECKVCTNKKALTKNREYKKRNRAKLAADQKIYYQENKERCAATKRKCYIKRKPYYLNKARVWVADRRKKDPIFSLRSKVSNSVFTAIRRGGSSKKGSILKHLPYTMQELKEHIEKQFDPWMSWDNYGVYRMDIWDDNDNTTWTWQIDHIIAHSRFNYTSMTDRSFLDCWALSNLRPYSSKQNLIDGKRK